MATFTDQQVLSLTLDYDDVLTFSGKGFATITPTTGSVQRDIYLTGNQTLGPYKQYVTLSITCIGTGSYSTASQTSVDQVATYSTDASGNVTGLVGSASNQPVASGYLVQVASSRAITASDIECVLVCASAVAITIPTDATLGISGSTYGATIYFQWGGAATPTFVASGTTINGSPPVISQYGFIGLIRTAANTWSYL